MFRIITVGLAMLLLASCSDDKKASEPNIEPGTKTIDPSPQPGNATPPPSNS